MAASAATVVSRGVRSTRALSSSTTIFTGHRATPQRAVCAGSDAVAIANSSVNSSVNGSAGRTNRSSHG